MGSNPSPRGDRNQSPLDERVRSLGDSLDRLLGEGELGDVPGQASDGALPELTDHEKAHVSRFTRIEVVEQALDERAGADPRSRRKRSV